MESLTPAQKSTITKSSSDRLRLNLMKSGYAEEVVLAWSREELITKYAELLVQGVDPAVVRPVDLELQRLDLERDKLKHDADFKSAELDFKDRTQNKEAKVLKRYGDALAQVMSHQPDEVTDLPSYFRGVEEQFEKIKIPLKYQARLIFRYLSPRARTLCSRLEPETRGLS